MGNTKGGERDCQILVGYPGQHLFTAMLFGSVCVQAWALLNIFGAVWFGQIWVGDGTGHFDSKGSIGALAVVDCQR